jgi:hypothetical protein
MVLLGSAIAQFFLGMLQFVIYGSAQHFLSAAFGGKGEFKNTIYAISAIMSPLSLMGSILNLAIFLVLLEPLKQLVAYSVTALEGGTFDTLQQHFQTLTQTYITYVCIGCSIGLLLGIYVLILNVRALKAVHNLNSALAVLVVIIAIAIMVAASYAISCCAGSFQPVNPSQLPTGY